MQAGVIGGTGKMGKLFAGILRRAGYTVRCSGRSGRPAYRELAEESDLVMVSVPIRQTVRVIEEIAPCMREDQILCDLTSVKVAPVNAMLGSRAEVIGLHPMFGPSVRTLRNQLIVVTPSRCTEESLASLLDIFRAEGAQITITTPELHDRMMAVVQGLTHFATLCVAEAMRRQYVDVNEALSFTSPVYRIELGLVGRLLSQDAGLYGDILQLNPCVSDVIAAFQQSAAELGDIVESGDPGLFTEFFRKNAEKYAEYSGKAMEETDALIECLVNR
jgi:prephenate dehydrogenase